MLKKLAVIAAVASLMTGCASVNMASSADSDKAKQFAAPAADKAGLYVYRDNFLGKALKKDVWVDGECLGETADGVFFYKEVPGNKKVKIDTESEFSPNTLEIYMEAGKNYFVRQFMKLGVFVHGAKVEQVPEQQAKADISKLNLAQSGKCSQ